MAVLPRNRMSEEVAFMFCDVDMFGSFVIKNGCKETKSYGALYTYLSSRAIHIIAIFIQLYSLNTDSFAICLSRFTGQGVNVCLIRSDNESNFIVASAKLIHG